MSVVSICKNENRCILMVLHARELIGFGIRVAVRTQNQLRNNRDVSAIYWNLILPCVKKGIFYDVTKTTGIYINTTIFSVCPFWSRQRSVQRLMDKKCNLTIHIGFRISPNLVFLKFIVQYFLKIINRERTQYKHTTFHILYIDYVFLWSVYARQMEYPYISRTPVRFNSSPSFHPFPCAHFITDFVKITYLGGPIVNKKNFRIQNLQP